MNEVAQQSGNSPGRLYPANLTPPVETLALAKSLLSAQHAEDSAKRHAQRAALARIEDRARHLALRHLQPDSAELKHLQHEYRELLEQRLKHHERGHRHHDTETAMDIVYGGSGLALAAPPYDFDWVSGLGPGFEQANRASGDYRLAVQSFGSGWRTVAAGVGFWFYSGEGNPRQRFAALLDYTDDWWDSAMFYVADSRAHTRLAVFGATEKTWVVRSEQAPSWSDHVGWLDSGGNDPEGEEGRISNETYFNAAPRSWYQCWVWSQADVYADSGIFGFGAASAALNIQLKFAVLGSL
jgi:hypothetical protein